MRAAPNAASDALASCGRLRIQPPFAARLRRNVAPLGTEGATGGPPEAFARHIAAERERYARIVKITGIRED